MWIAPKICLDLKQGGGDLNSGICKSQVEGCPSEGWAKFLACGKTAPISQGQVSGEGHSGRCQQPTHPSAAGDGIHRPGPRDPNRAPITSATPSVASSSLCGRSCILPRFSSAWLNKHRLIWAYCVPGPGEGLGMSTCTPITGLPGGICSCFC